MKFTEIHAAIQKDFGAEVALAAGHAYQYVQIDKYTRRVLP